MAVSTTTAALEATNVAVLQGRVAGPPRHRELASGSVVVELDVTTRGADGAVSVPVAWFDAGDAADRLAGGDDVLVVGQVRRRFFRSDGRTQSRTEVVATRVVPIARRAQVARAVAEVSAALQAGPGGAARSSRRGD